MSYSTCEYTTEIDENECIGDSLTTINANFSALDVAVCNLSPALTVNDSQTIDLSLTNNNALSANVRPDSIRYSQLASWQSLSASPTLSAEAVQPRLVKAKGYFVTPGTLNTPFLSSFDAFNIASLTRIGATDGYSLVSRYLVRFITPVPTPYSVLTRAQYAGQNGSGQDANGHPQNAPAVFTPTDSGIPLLSSDGFRLNWVADNFVYSGYPTLMQLVVF